MPSVSSMDSVSRVLYHVRGCFDPFELLFPPKLPAMPILMHFLHMNLPSLLLQALSSLTLGLSTCISCILCARLLRVPLLHFHSCILCSRILLSEFPFIAPHSCILCARIRPFEYPFSTVQAPWNFKGLACLSSSRCISCMFYIPRARLPLFLHMSPVHFMHLQALSASAFLSL